MLMCAVGAGDMPFKVERESDGAVVQAKALPNGLLDVARLQSFCDGTTCRIVGPVKIY
jgi:hypothetical protein